MDIARRTFIRGLLGLAALAVAPSIPLSLVRSEQEKFLASVKDNIVEGKTFYLKQPVVLNDINNLTILNCKFVAMENYSGPLIEIGDNCYGVVIQYCKFYYGDATPYDKNYEIKYDG